MTHPTRADGGRGLLGAGMRASSAAWGAGRWSPPLAGGDMQLPSTHHSRPWCSFCPLGLGPLLPGLQTEDNCTVLAVDTAAIWRGSGGGALVPGGASDAVFLVSRALRSPALPMLRAARGQGPLRWRPLAPTRPCRRFGWLIVKHFLHPHTWHALPASPDLAPAPSNWPVTLSAAAIDPSPLQQQGGFH